MRGFWMALGALACLAACGPRAEQAEPPAPTRAITDPAPVVAQIYEPYLAANGRARPLLEAAPWSNSMREALVAMQARSAEMEGPILDFDPLINAQDWRLSDLSTTTDAAVEGSHAVVRASFVNAGVREEVIYDLVWEDDRWKVENVRGAQWNLRAIITPAPP